MSDTFRHGKGKTKVLDDRDHNDFWYKHDSKEDRDGLNSKFREEEKQYFIKFGEVKYNQKPKSRGWKTW
jgi:hypothetical protein